MAMRVCELLAVPELDLEVGDAHGEPGGQAFDDDDEGAPVGVTGGEEAEHAHARQIRPFRTPPRMCSRR